MNQYNNKTILLKITDVISGNPIKRITKKYNSDYRTQHFNTKSHIFSMIYLQLSNTLTLRGLGDKLKYTPKLQRIIDPVSVSQLSRKNSNRDYRVFEDLFYEVINVAKRRLGLIKLSKHFNIIKVIDSSIIQVASTLAPKFNFRKGKSGIKISTLLNITQEVPERIEIVPALTNDRHCISDFINNKDTLYIFDRGYVCFEWYDQLSIDGYKFITRESSNTCVKEIKKLPDEEGVILIREVALGNPRHYITKEHYREITVLDEEQKEIRFITNIFDIPASQIAELYRLRWKIEIFFKWIKQNLKIKKWLGYNENAIKIQIYSALIAYILLLLFKLTIPSITISITQFGRVITANLLEEVVVFELFSG